MIGGTGALGRHICAALLRGGAYSVTAVARHEAPVASGARLVRADLLADDDNRALCRLVAGSDVVVNAAGAGWRGTPDQMDSAHTVLVERLLRSLSPGIRLVHIGSVHEYGEIRPHDAADERHPERPSSIYGRTKLTGTRRVMEAAAEGRSDGVVLRVTNACGPGAPTASFIGFLIERLHQLPPGLPLDLELAPDTRDFVDIRDVADAVVRAATAPVTGFVINIGRGAVHDVPTVARELIKAAGFPLERVRMRAAAVPGDKGRCSAWTRVDVRRARALLGWSHTRCLEDSLRDQWEAASALVRSTG
ncbi:NAD(P)-dependent oxidoreductase [Streptomyces sp. NPDC047525]|uniref:NAD-dependent epimerase/dehydratase family protein n=1 Tax=Streptomyces sp. NPDC047525 TaxID=3155264 RepID=UPI0033ED9B40